MARNLPFARIPDAAYPAQVLVSWFLNRNKLIGTDVTLGANAPLSDDTLNILDHQLLCNIERLYDLTALRGDTASRPTEYQHQYFDTDLGLPIWWDGDNWVNASGTTV
jgi:hypothetical protein